MLIAQGVLVVLFGLCIGSFSNVLIHRLPRGESIVSPGSRCPYCKHPIAPRDMIPIYSYFALRGGCRHCTASISPRYPLIEGATALLYLLCFLRFGWSLQLILSAVLCTILLVSAMVDMEHMMVLDELLIAGGVIALALNIGWGTLCTWQDMLLGIPIGAAPLLLIALAGRVLTGRQVMGGGDIKLMAMVGAFLGWQAALLTLAFASIGGGLVMLALLAVKKIKQGKEIPFVPMLAGGATLALFVSKPLIAWYLGLFL